MCEYSKEIEKIERIRSDNFEILEKFSKYLTDTPKAVNAKIIKKLKCSSEDEKFAYAAVLSKLFGYDTNDDEDKTRLYREYLIPSINKLNPNEYLDNPYLKNINVPEIKIGSWQLKKELYEPYEAFIYDDLTVKNNLKEIPNLGFFDKAFYFPAVTEKNVEWMTVTPNEINTMKNAITKANGKVVTFGLGLGYFAFMASEKENVKSVTVIERDENVINLFSSYILPQFKNKNKIKIIKADAFEYVKDMSVENYDFAFVDLWHDSSDGLPLYLKMKKCEIFSPKTEFSYWIETSLLSRLRWSVYENIYNSVSNGEKLNFNGSIIDRLNDLELKKILNKF